jgi:hypothetical protein
VQPSHSEVKPEDVRGRAEVARLIPLDPEGALRLAREIRHPWYRCQAIAYVAAAQPSRTVALRLLQESLAAALEQSEPNRIVSVASWPLRQLAKLDSIVAAAQARDLLQIISREPHGLRRLDGITRILAAVAEQRELLEIAKPPFVAAVAASEGWRTERTVAFVVALLAPIDRPFAESLIASRASNRFLNAAVKALQSCPMNGSAPNRSVNADAQTRRAAARPPSVGAGYFRH